MSDPIPELKATVEEIIQSTASHAEWLIDFVDRMAKVDELEYGSDVIGRVLIDWLEFERRDAEANKTAARGKKAVNALSLLGDDSLSERFNMALIAVILAHSRIQVHAKRLKNMLDAGRNKK